MTAEHVTETPMTPPVEPKAETMPPADVEIPETTGIMDRVIEGSIGKALKSVDAHNVFGDPVTQGNRTVIPVARVTINYGFGAGSGRAEDEEKGPTGSGGGGGGRVRTNAIGYIEMTPDEARFVPILDRSTLITSLISLAGFALFLSLPRLLRRRR